MGRTLLEMAGPNDILACVNGRLHEITDRMIENEDVRFVTLSESIGNQTYRRSTVMLMLYAISKVESNSVAAKTIVDFSISKGLYCRIDGFEITDEFISNIKRTMEEAVSRNIPIVKSVMKTKDAIKMFDEAGMTEKVRIGKYRHSSFVNVYEIDGYKDYFYGYMAPSTGILKYFDLFRYDEGFVLQMPVKSEPASIPDFAPAHKLFKVLKDTTTWAESLDMGTIGAINDHVASNDVMDMILVQEAIQEQRIVEIADAIKAKPSTKFVMIAGPSSSGKTTFANRLSVQLRANGYIPHKISVDDYFVEREETPLDEEGNYNFEDLHAIDIELFNNHMQDLLDGKEIEMPEFNFKTGKKEYHGNTLSLGEGDILVIEGIHCLNDEMSYKLPKESKFKIYISALTQLNIDEHNRVATTDGRLIRRMVRDSRTRGASAKRTLSMWESVRKGEEKNIFPFQEEADAMFNSALTYELAVLKPFAEPLLYSIGEDEPEYHEAKRLLKFLDCFLTCVTDSVPIDSILREFMGGGCFKV